MKKYGFRVRGDFLAYSIYAKNKEDVKKYCKELFGVNPLEIWE